MSPAGTAQPSKGAQSLLVLLAALGASILSVNRLS